MDEMTNCKPSPDLVRYELRHEGTEFGTGSFACLPSNDLDVEHGWEYIQAHPYDEFMHKHLLHLAGRFGPNLIRQLIQKGKEENPPLSALMYEACILNERLHDLIKEFEGTDIQELAQHTPLIFIDWTLREYRKEDAYWTKVFSENILAHRPRWAARDLELPLPFDQQAVDAWRSRVTPIERLVQPQEIKDPEDGLWPPPATAETAAMAAERLHAIDLALGHEAENQATLSPWALQMPWRLQIRVSSGRNHWQLTGPQTSYGKGLTEDQAKASCRMEVVERVSSFASFDQAMALHYREGHRLIHGGYEDLKDGTHQVLDPNEMLLEVPYKNQPLYWICAERVDERGPSPTYVPAQLAFLFSNLDEISLTSGLPSTGLAAGKTVEEAKVNALLEVIERDGEKVMPYVEERAFSLTCDRRPVTDILKRCTREGIHVQFLDITSELGIPCYKAFIQGQDGRILKGTAAHLDGRRAAVSALTEVPYHPSWFAPLSADPDLRELAFESLPDYSSGDARHDLAALERVLTANGYRPVYVDLTREDLAIPVVRALVPGLEIFSDFDQFSRPSLRQFGHYFFKV